MTRLFAFPASDALRADFDAVLAAFSGPELPAEPQAPRVVQLTQRYADEIVDALMLNLMKGADAGSSAPKSLETVAGLIKSTVHTLIRQVLSKLDNADLKPVSVYIGNRRTRLERDGVARDYISFSLSEADYALLGEAWSAAARGEGDREQMTRAMLRFSELAIEAFYEESAKAIKLGFIARNMFSVGQTAISKGSKAAISKMVPALGRGEMKAFGTYFQGMLQTA